MAAKAPDNETETQPKGAKIMRLVQLICFIMALCSASILFIGAYDFGMFDFRMTISSIAIGVVPVFILSAALYSFAQSKVMSAQQAADQERLAGDQADIDLKIKAAQEKFDTYLGEEFKTLKSENESMKAELERMEVAEREKLEQENNFLKEQNSLLKEQITTRANGTSAPVSDGDQLAVMDSSGSST